MLCIVEVQAFWTMY